MSSSAIRAGAAYIELTLRDRVSRPLHAASVALKDFGNSVAWQGAKVAAMGAAITAPLAAMAHGFAQSALELGRVGDRRDAANVMNYVASLTRLSEAFATLRAAVGGAVLPLMTRWPNALARILRDAAAWVRNNRVLVQTIARFGAALGLAGTAIVFLGKGIATVGSALGVLSRVFGSIASAVGMLGGVLAGILTPLGLLAVGAAVFGAYMLHSTGVAGEALTWLQDKFAEVHDDAIKSWQGIGDALATGDIKLAAEILWLSIKMEWQKGVNFINQMWINAKEFFVKLWTDAVFGVAMLFTDGWATVESAWTETVAFLRQGWLSFTGFMSKNLNWAVGEMQKLWVKFRKWLGEDIDVNAKVREIDAKTKEEEQRIDTDTKSKKAATEERRSKRRTEIEARRRGAQDVLAQDVVRAQQGNDNAFEAERKASEQAAAEAKAEWDNARQRAADQRKQFREPPPKFYGMLEAEQQKFESKGTFSAAAVRGLGSDSLAERTAKATERGAALLKNIDENARKAAGLFA